MGLRTEPKIDTMTAKTARSMRRGEIAAHSSLRDATFVARRGGKMMRLLAWIVALAGLSIVPVPAAASPITPGHWSDVGPAAKDGVVFWDNPSVDCGYCAAGELLDIIFGPLEFLNDGNGKATPFKFTEPVSFTTLGGLSLWKGGTLLQNADGSFSYDNGQGFLSNSWADGSQFALFRHVGPDSTQYFLGIEDMSIAAGLVPSDQDYNDYIASFTLSNVPEPSTLLLMGAAVAGYTIRRLRRRS
jgi:hypothetical protein